MKKILLGSIMVLSGTVAQAATVRCVDVSQGEATAASTVISIYQSTVIVQPGGVAAKLAPLRFPARSKQIGNSIYEFSNESKGFALEVSFAGDQGHLQAYLLEAHGERVRAPYSCTLSGNEPLTFDPNDPNRDCGLSINGHECI